MANLVTVRFTQRKIGIKLDGKGREIGRTEADIPVVLTGIPYSTAMSYKDCDNFSIERYDLDTTSQIRRAGPTKMRPRPDTEQAVVRARPAAPTPRDEITRAAATGDLSKAL